MRGGLEKILYTPTSEEVCNELSNYYEIEWVTLFDLIAEHNKNACEEHHKHILYPRELYTASPAKSSKLPNTIGIRKGVVYGIGDLPPHIITIIGQYYQSIKESE